MKVLLLIMLVACKLTSTGQGNNPFASLKHDKVIMYDFDPADAKGGSIVEDNGLLTKDIKKVVTLEASTARKLGSKLGDKTSFGGGTASCFIPHLGFVFYEGTKIVGHVTICMACNRLHSSHQLPAQKQGRVGKGKEAYYIKDGMSKSFRQFLNGLLIINKFSHQSTQ